MSICCLTSEDTLDPTQTKKKAYCKLLKYVMVTNKKQKHPDPKEY
jgi:hypothetical protein